MTEMTHEVETHEKPDLSSPVTIPPGNAEVRTGFSYEGVAIGVHAATGEPGVAIGPRATGPDDGRVVVIGEGAEALDGAAVAIGDGAEAGNVATAVGSGTHGNGEFSIAVGRWAESFSDGSIAIGVESSVGNIGSEGGIAPKAIAIGRNASASADNAVAIGAGAGMPIANAGRIGVDQLLFGGTQDTVGNGQLNNGEMTVEMDEDAGAFRLRGKDSNGTVREATVSW